MGAVAPLPHRPAYKGKDYESMPLDLNRRLRAGASALSAALAAGGMLASSVAEAGKKRRNRNDSESERAQSEDDRERVASREDRRGDKADRSSDGEDETRRDRKAQRNDDDGGRDSEDRDGRDSGRDRERQQSGDDDANDPQQNNRDNNNDGGGGTNDPVGGRAGDAADKLRNRGEKLTGFDGRQNDDGGNNDTGSDYDGEGIDSLVDPQTGVVEFDNGNITFIQEDDGSATIVTDNIELERGPDPAPFEFPPLELPESDGLPTVPGSASTPPAGDGGAPPASSSGDGGNADAGADGGSIDTGNIDDSGGDNSSGPLS